MDIIHTMNSGNGTEAKHIVSRTTEVSLPEANNLQKRASTLASKLILMTPISATPDGFSWMDRHLTSESSLPSKPRILIQSAGKIVAWIHFSKALDNNLDIEHVSSTLSIAGLQGLITTFGKYREHKISLDTNKAHSIMKYLHALLSDFDLSRGQANTEV